MTEIRLIRLRGQKLVGGSIAMMMVSVLSVVALFAVAFAADIVPGNVHVDFNETSYVEEAPR